MLLLHITEVVITNNKSVKSEPILTKCHLR
jgi:hypothetical protein